MKLTSIEFENYKAFFFPQKVKLRPITILIGKNSSGKSSIAKLFTLLENSLSGNIDEPLLLVNNDVELGGAFRDLSYGQQPSIPVRLAVTFDEDIELKVGIVQEASEYNLVIFEWSYSSALFSISLTYNPEQGYLDGQGNSYQCKFKGILATEIIGTDGINRAGLINQNLSIDVDYIGPFRKLPIRQFSLTGKIGYRDMGAQGENAYAILAISRLMKTNLHIDVGDWYERFFDGWKLEVSETSRPFLEVNLKKNTSKINIVDVGQGMNQALPLVVRAFTKRADSLVVFEQPELHLHPAAHGDLAELFASSAKTGNQNFVIETHSENILLRLRKLAVENDFSFSSDDIIIYWVEENDSGSQELREITVDSEGILSDWPYGVFNEDMSEIQEMRQAVRRKKNQ